MLPGTVTGPEDRRFPVTKTPDSPTERNTYRLLQYGCYGGGPFGRVHLAMHVVQSADTLRIFPSPLSSFTISLPNRYFTPKSCRRRRRRLRPTHSGDPYLLSRPPIDATTWYSTTGRCFQSTWITLQSFKYHQGQGVLEISGHKNLNDSKHCRVLQYMVCRRISRYRHGGYKAMGEAMKHNGG